MLRLAIVDDEEFVCSMLERQLISICATLNLHADIDIYTSGERLISSLNDHNSYNLIFLDIELRKCNGIDVSRYIRENLSDNTTQIVYVTGKTEYDRQLFEFRPFDFISKPVGIDRLMITVEKYIRIFGNNNEMFHYRIGHDIFWVKTDDIMFFESRDRMVRIKTISSDQVFYASLSKIQDQLKNKGFILPHKSYLVNYRHIKAFRPEYLVIATDDRLPIAKSKRKEVARLQILLENGGNR